MTQNTICTETLENFEAKLAAIHDDQYAKRSAEAVEEASNPAWAAKTLGNLNDMIARCKK